jgi:hypothetical protein
VEPDRFGGGRRRDDRLVVGLLTVVVTRAGAWAWRARHRV